MTAEILCVGTELLLGNIVNTNAAFISRELAGIGIFVYHQSVVGDNPERLAAALEFSLSRSDIVVMTGGLGPTYDDLTKETAAKYFNLEMKMHEHSRQRLIDFFNRLNAQMTANNEKQALMPEGAVVFDNDYGTAPALAIEKDGKIVIMLPGPPREMEPMFTECIKPYLLKKNAAEKNSAAVLISKTIHIFGMGESAVESKLAGFMKNSLNPTVAPYAKEGEVELRVTALGRNESDCLEKIEPVIGKIKSEIGDYIYGIDVKSLQNALVQKLIEKNMTIATAESCTGGLIGARITEISGSSKVYLGGVVSYSNQIKIDALGVNTDTIAKYGAVSSRCAEEMAYGIVRLTNADVGVSVTGIAGPDGGTPEKPVGLVYIGLCTKTENGEVFTEHRKLNLSRGYRNERGFIRKFASSSALRLCLQKL